MTHVCPRCGLDGVDVSHEVICKPAVEDAPPRTPLRDLVEKWRGVIKASPVMSATDTFHKCADELEAALRAATPEPQHTHTGPMHVHPDCEICKSLAERERTGQP